jgi:O-antigen/teichoic acid export membrane protein
MPQLYNVATIKYFIKYLSERVIGQALTPHSRDFIINVAITSASTIVVGGLGVITTTLLGRLLGPGEFGEYSLIISLAQLIVIFLTLGMQTALTHTLPRSDSVAATVHSAIPLLLGTIVISSFLYLQLMPLVVHWLHIPVWSAYCAWGLAVAYAVRYVTDALLRGRRLFKISAWLDGISASLGFLVCIGLLSYGWRVGSILILVPASIAGLFAIGGLWLSRKVLGWRMTGESWRLFQYGFWSVVVGLTQLVLLQVDKLLVNYYYDTTVLGIYTAYLSGALLMIAFIFTITNYVLLPESSRIADITSLLTVLDRRKWYLILIMSVAYPWHFSWLVLVSIYAGVYFYANILVTIAFSRGKQVVKKLPLLTGLAVLIYIVTFYILVPHIGLSGFFIALIVAYGVLAVVVTNLLRYNTRIV